MNAEYAASLGGFFALLESRTSGNDFASLFEAVRLDACLHCGTIPDVDAKPHIAHESEMTSAISTLLSLYRHMGRNRVGVDSIRSFYAGCNPAEYADAIHDAYNALDSWRHRIGRESLEILGRLNPHVDILVDSWFKSLEAEVASCAC